MASNHVAVPRNSELQSPRRRVHVAGLFDSSYERWTPSEILEVAVDLINDHEDGWFDDVLNDGTELVLSYADSGCDPGISLPAYWDLRTNWGQEETEEADLSRSTPRVHGVVGCRCSDATAIVARVAGLDGIPMVSPVSSAADLSNSVKYPSFFRLVGPDDERGQVGALVSLLRKMEWEWVSILATDTKYAKDMMRDFSSLWVGDHAATGDDSKWFGKVVYSHTIELNADNTVNEKSVLRALNGAPKNNPSASSRVILLLAHHQHAYPILKIARDANFQPDTTWVGTEWVGTEALSEHLPRYSNGNGASWMPEIPGYLGVSPYRSQNDVYKDFLGRLQASQQSRGLPPVDYMDYYAEMIVDSLLALAMALSRVSHEKRGDGQAVMKELFNVKFTGLSGPVSFTAEGDRANPQFSVLHWQNTSGATEVGTIGTTLDSANIRMENICWPGCLGCAGVSKAPSEKYSSEENTEPLMPTGAWVAIAILLAGMVALGFYIRRDRHVNRQKMHDEFFKQHQELAEAKRDIEANIERKEEEIDEMREKLAKLEEQPFHPQEKPSTWTDSPNILVEVEPNELEYQEVSYKLQNSMEDAIVTKLYRVQNQPLWIYYNFHKQRFRDSGMTGQEEEIQVWHGTSGNDPIGICEDKQDGFLTGYARKGLWGRGLYFADKSCYSDEYAFCRRGMPLQAASGEDSSGPLLATERCEEAEEEEEYELILSLLLLGKAEFMERPSPDLEVPPTIDSSSSLRFNTVSGYTRGGNGVATKVWVVYENGRAYPNYLVRYKRKAQRATAKTNPSQSTRSPAAGSGLVNSSPGAQHTTSSGQLCGCGKDLAACGSCGQGWAQKK